MTIQLNHNHTFAACVLPDRIYLERAAHPVFGKEGKVEVVLAFLPHNATTPYVTWDHMDGNDHSGDYFCELPAAVEGFLKRIGKKK
jgi:hypothetical protein